MYFQNNSEKCMNYTQTSEFQNYFRNVFLIFSRLLINLAVRDISSNSQFFLLKWNCNSLSYISFNTNTPDPDY